MKGEPEEIFSKLAVEPVLRTYILSLIATGFVKTEEDIIKFFSKTFWAHQYKNMEKLEAIIEKILGLLESWEFVSTHRAKQASGFISADELNIDKLTATKIPDGGIGENSL